MARQRKDKDKASVKLSQPDRSAPTGQTRLGLAQERNLFEQAAERDGQVGFREDEGGRLGDAGRCRGLQRYRLYRDR